MVICSPTRNILLRQRCLRGLNALRSLLTKGWVGLRSYKKNANTVRREDVNNMLVIKQYTHFTSVPCWTPLRLTLYSFTRTTGPGTHISPIPWSVLSTMHVKRARPMMHDEGNGPTNSRLRCEAPRKNKYGYQRSRVSLEIAICLQSGYFGARRI